MAETMNMTQRRNLSTARGAARKEGEGWRDWKIVAHFREKSQLNWGMSEI